MHSYYSEIQDCKFKCPYLAKEHGVYPPGGICLKNDSKLVPDLKKICANNSMELYQECPYYNKKIDPFAK